MRKKLLVITFLFFSLKGICFQVDTAIFISDFEKEVFLNYLETKNTDPIRLFIASKNVKEYSQIQKQLDSYIEELEKSNISDYKIKKKLKTIYNSVHGKFLKKYNEETYFGEIFTDGEFNCVSASALYSIVLDHFRVEYNIKETPTHVYLIADPENTSYLIETTLPTSGLFHFDDKFKKNYIEYLRDNKIISENEYKNKSIALLFNEYYITDETIDLYKLAGLQYFNNGIFSFNNEDYEMALQDFEKAEILYPSDKIRFVKNGAIAGILNDENIKNDYRGKLLAKFINNNSENSSIIKYCHEYFESVSNEMIMNHPNINRYNNYFEDFKDFVKDSINVDDIFQSYYTFEGFYYYSNFKYQRALQALEKAYAINSSNIRTRQLISEITLKHLVNRGNYESTIDSILFYKEKFNFLENNDILFNLLGYSYAQIIGSNFQMDNIKKGLNYLNQFEELIEQSSNFIINDEYVGYAYGQAASYYFRKYNYKQAEVNLLKGLDISPKSVELKQRLETLQNAGGSLSGYTRTDNGNKKYKNALASAQKNKISINQSVSKYLVGKWKMVKCIEDGFESKVTGENSFELNLLKSKNVIFTEGKNHHTGTWSYNDNTCTLKLKDSKYGDYMNFLILEISNNKIIGIMYFEDEYSEVVDVVFSILK